MCIISDIIGISKEKQMHLPNEEYIGCHWSEWMNMAARCEISEF